MEEYASINPQLTYDNPDFTLPIDGIPNDPYAVDEYYYAELVMKEYQACPSKVANMYFSVTNIKRIQRGIKREIYNRSYGKFKLEEDQSVLDLITAMRIVY